MIDGDERLPARVTRADQALAEAVALRDRSQRLLQLATNRVEIGDAAPIARTRAAVVARQDDQRLVEARVAREAARRRLAGALILLSR